MGKARRSKGGRTKQPGARDKRGRLVKFDDKGNDRVQQLRASFAVFHGGKADGQVHDPIGRAWACGLLDGFDADPEAIREAGRNYHSLYWGASGYPSSSGTANYEGQDRRGGSGGDYSSPDPRGERFQMIDRALLNAGRSAYDAAQDLCLGLFPDENPGWLDRLINGQRLEEWKQRNKDPDRLPPIYGMLPISGDHSKLALAVSALVAVVQGTERRRVA